MNLTKVKAKANCSVFPQNETMDAKFAAKNSNDWITISLPAAATTAAGREDFISFLKLEWGIRKSRFTRKNAEEFATEVDAGWWSAHREAVLARIEGA